MSKIKEDFYRGMETALIEKIKEEIKIDRKIKKMLKKQQALLKGKLK